MYLKTIISFAILFIGSVFPRISQMMLLKWVNKLIPHECFTFPLFNINLGICLIPDQHNKGMSHTMMKCWAF